MERKEYDKVIHSRFKENIIIDYGIVKGNNIIFFIKSGQDGSIYGYLNKYLIMADTINKKYGYTVIASSNPFDGENPLDDAMNVIKEYIQENNFEDYKIYYMGQSNGALIGAWYGTNCEKIEKMLLINIPLSHDIDVTKECISNFKGKKLVLIYGTRDDSIDYVKELNGVLNDKITLHYIEGQDHLFSKDTYDFKKLPEEYLF